MQTILYYFTGTGNSLAAARALGERISDAKLVPIPKLLLENKKVTVPKDANVGIIAPLYAMGLPNIVVRFFDIVDLSEAGYVFSMITEGGTYGSPTKQIQNLAKKSGHELNAAWWIQMPDNYIPMGGAQPKDVQKKIREEALRKISVISNEVGLRKTHLTNLTLFGKFLQMVMYKIFLARIKNFDEKFVVSHCCNGCMICARVCPVNNIQSLPKGKKAWQHNCEGCLACLQFCPVEAISCGKGTDERARYHHPNVTADDMTMQKGTGILEAES